MPHGEALVFVVLAALMSGVMHNNEPVLTGPISGPAVMVTVPDSPSYPQ